MDIRVAAYSPVTVSTLTRPGQPTATAYVQNAAQSGPVPQINAVRQPARDNQAALRQFGANFATTETRGTRVNILA